MENAHPFVENDEAPKPQADAADAPAQATLTEPPPPPPAAEAAAPPAASPQPAAAPEADPLLAAAARMSSSASWFFFIGGLSIVNTLIALFKNDTSFVVAPMITSILNAVAQDAPGGVKAILLVVSLAIAGLFLLFGVLSRQGRMGAYVTGTVIYALDTLLLLIDLGNLWLYLLFHVWALFSLVAGIRACAEFNRLKKAAEGSATPAFQQSNVPPPPQYAPQEPPQQPTTPPSE